MFSARISPWYAQGQWGAAQQKGDPKVTILNEAPKLTTVRDLDTILDLSGLNWTASKRPLRVAKDVSISIPEDSRPGLRRVSTGVDRSQGSP